VSHLYRPDGTASDWFGHTDGDYGRWLSPLIQGLPPAAPVLDLGCGCGVPADQLLAKRFRVTGVDLSDVQIERARKAVPGATFRQGDLASVEFEAATFDAVVALYSLIHVPVEEQRLLLPRIHRWLRPGGWFLFVGGHSAGTGVEDDWLGSGAPMYWSHPDAATYRRWLAVAGFRLLTEEQVAEPGAVHALFLARRDDAVTASPGPPPA
jgi:SAM-dependent methyltransferase